MISICYDCVAMCYIAKVSLFKSDWLVLNMNWHRCLKVLKEATDDKEIKIINVEESHQEDVETLTTIVEVGEQEKGKDQREREANIENENSVMMALSQLSKLMGEIEEPKQDKENVLGDVKSTFTLPQSSM